MYEIFAILAGVVIALVVRRSLNPRLRAVALVTCSVLIGVLVSLISGELSLSWVYPVFDIAQVLLASVAAMALIARSRSVGRT